MNIRPMLKTDLLAVLDIISQHWSDDFNVHISNRFKDFTEHPETYNDQDFIFLIAEENNEIVGIAGMRKAPDAMKIYSITPNPAEFYILAVKYKNKGIGTALRNFRIQEAKKLGYTEIVLFSSETHQDSWKFHDDSNFKRVGTAIAPNGEKGIIWQMILN